MSSLSTPTWSACAVFTLVTVSATNSRAGTIVGLSPFLDPGIYSIAAQGVIPGTANNDNIAGTSDNQLFILQKDYVSVGFVDIVATVVDSGGVTEYVVNENVQNSTTVDWTGYRIELGFGTGTDFIPSTVGDGLDFDTPDEDSPINFSPGAADFTTITRPSEDELVASDGDLLAGEFSGVDFVFHIDVPDGITEFTIRQRPIADPVPESGSSLLLGIALAACCVRRNRR